VYYCSSYADSSTVLF
nr:immunoglobulin light chain junction region [Macaca mulatta]MOW68026.1 immunoglobulin light chain junction region [Macaca mulatta]